LDLEPILCLKSKVIFVKKIQKGMSVSYGRTYIADKPRNIATVAVGYADGYPWNLSNRAKVIIADTFFEVVGRVCMDHIMVDLKDREDIKPGEEVILIGSAKNKKISVESIADIAGTIPYEIVSRLSLKIPRIYKHGKKENT
jgi:alanine racemase